MPTVTPEVAFVSLGPESIGYTSGEALQRRAHDARVRSMIGDVVYLLEHAPVVTVGRSTSTLSNIRTPIAELLARGIDVVESDRGGDVTYHAPGQLVVYPVLELKRYGRDIHWYIRTLELTVIDTIRKHGLVATAVPGLTGVWTPGGKIAALGIRVSRWVSMHGVAINRDIDLSPMRDDIVPCGISDRPVTSLGEGGVYISRHRLELDFMGCFAQRFGARVDWTARSVDEEMFRIGGSRSLPAGRGESEEGAMR